MADPVNAGSVGEGRVRHCGKEGEMDDSSHRVDGEEPVRKGRGKHRKPQNHPGVKRQNVCPNSLIFGI